MASGGRVSHPRILLRDALQHSSVDTLSKAVAASRSGSVRGCSPEEFIPHALTACIREGKLELARYLLEDEHVPATAIKPTTLLANFSFEMLELLVANGWDINSEELPGPTSCRKKLIDLSCDRDDLVKWLVEHGARIDYGQEYYEIMPQPAPLLETCALFGSVSTFKYLQENGAKLGTRTLHRAAEEAAVFGADPALEDGSGFGSDGDDDAAAAKKRRRKVEMLRYLVDEVKLDVNAIDTDIPGHAWHWGPPISYAAGKPNGAAVVKWLLAKGADPTIKNLQSNADAEEVARSLGCIENAELINQWKREHASEK
ncbi:hypothetical protein BGZ63DRAFT_395244 [Mariannaea sp. PMI_226]|nr:hypothetical protein BGZ63DRAFT_395244 [Mariannaea sp. PMI_226]